MKKENNFVENLKILDGTITYNDFDIDEILSFEDQKYNLQIKYGEGLTLDVGWYPAYNPKGFFVTRAIENYDWETPLSKIKCRSLANLKKAIEKTAILIVEARKNKQ